MSLQTWFPWLLTVIGVSSLWFAGLMKWWSWAVLVAAQVLWIYFGIATEQYGFVAMALAYGGVYAKNGWSWYQDQKTIGRETRNGP